MPPDLLGASTRRAVSLADVLRTAPALTRIDRKYLVPVEVAGRLLDALPEEWGVLRIGERTATTYRSTYFDGPRLETARAHVQRRRRRWKARSRLYVEDRLCRTELKAKDGRGHTVKTVVDTPCADYGVLTETARGFLRKSLGEHGIEVDTSRLVSTIEVGYQRMTLARLDDRPARLTLDWGVRADLGGATVGLDHGLVLVETKGGLRAGDADRLLVGFGARPRPFSKYAGSAALLLPDLPDNDVRSLCGTALHVGGAIAVAG